MGFFSQVFDGLVDAVAPIHGNRRRAARFQREQAEKMAATIEERRARAKRQEELSAGGYKSADNSRSAHSWMTSNLSPDSQLEADRQTMIDRADSAIKNYELAANHVEGRVVRVAGGGMTVEPTLTEVAGVITKAQADAWNDVLRDAWERTAERIGKHGEAIWEIQHLMQRYWESRGEWFLLVGDEYDPLSPTTLKVEVIDPDRVSTPPEKSSNPRIRMGVETDANGKVVAYYIKVSEAGDTVDVRERWERKAAKFANGLPQVIHHFARKKAGQHRGFPQMQVGQSRLKNAEEYAEAELERNWIASCHAAFVRTDLGMDDAMDSHGVVQNSNGVRVRDINPGMIQYLGYADSIEFSDPSGPPSSFKEFMEHEGRMFAAGCGTSYEILANNWVGTTYNGGRVLWNIEDGFCSVQQKGHAKTITDLYRLFVTRAVVTGIIEVSQSLYRSQPWLFWSSRTIPPAKLSIDPSREDRNDLVLVEAGVIPHSDLAERKNGRPAERVYDTIRRNRKLMKEYGINTTMPQMGRGVTNAPTQIGDSNQESSDANSERQETEAAA